MEKLSLSEVDTIASTSLTLLPAMSQIDNKNEDSGVVTMAKGDRQFIGGITFCIILQCIAVFIASASILRCMWNPDFFSNQYVKVVLVMYLYDYKDCGYGIASSKIKGSQNIELNKVFNKTNELHVKPLRFSELIKSTSIRLTQKTHTYLEVSIGFHCVWLTIAIVAWISCQVNILTLKYLKLIVGIFMYASIAMVIFDVSMAIVYLAHIQQSLTLSMVLRYAGWAVELQVKNPEQFAGWIPMVASAVWMRGIVFLIVNLIFIKAIWGIRKKIKKKEVIKKHTNKKNAPIPDTTFSLHTPHEKALILHA